MFWPFDRSQGYSVEVRLGFGNPDWITRLEDFLFDFVHRCSKALNICETDIAILPKLREVTDVANVSRQVERHLPQEKEQVTRPFGQ